VFDLLCVGQRHRKDANKAVMLFLLMRPRVLFTQKLITDIKKAIQEKLSARHVPKYVFETPEMPVR
jgi:acetoacetyl-CoA synthetase